MTRKFVFAALLLGTSCQAAAPVAIRYTDVRSLLAALVASGLPCVGPQTAQAEGAGAANYLLEDSAVCLIGQSRVELQIVEAEPMTAEPIAVAGARIVGPNWLIASEDHDLLLRIRAKLGGSKITA